MRVEVAIAVPYRAGKAEVDMRYAADNRVWLHRAIETRRPVWVPATKRWLVPRNAARRIYDAATAERRSASITHVFRPETDVCTEQCRSARIDTVDSCTCVCGGANHGHSSPGWRQVGNHLLVRSGGDGLITRTLTNGIR